MSSNVVNQVSYIRTTRDFPTEAKELSVELNKAYIDIANTVNARTIGIFPINRPAITGESWFISKNQRQQTLRQVFQFTNFNPISHGIKFNSLTTFTKITGIGFDGVNYLPIPYVDGGVPTNNLGIFVSPNQIIFTPGGTRGNLTGFILLEWLSNP